MTRTRALWAALVLVAATVAGCGDSRAPVDTAGAEHAASSSSTTHPPSQWAAPADEVPRQPPPTTTTTATTLPPAPPTTVEHVHAEAVAPPTRANQPQSGDGLGWASTIAAHFPPEQHAKACQVMRCETGNTGDPTIHNPSSSASGLWQFLDSTWRSTTGLAPPAAAYSGDQQTAAAATLWRSSGWSPWACA